MALLNPFTLGLSNGAGGNGMVCPLIWFDKLTVSRALFDWGESYE
jgi:hypothetical protein